MASALSLLASKSTAMGGFGAIGLAGVGLTARNSLGARRSNQPLDVVDGRQAELRARRA